MKSDSIPKQLQPMLVPVRCLGSEKRAGGIGAIYFEASVRGDEGACGVPAEIVQDCGYGVEFFVDGLEGGDF